MLLLLPVSTDHLFDASWEGTAAPGNTADAPSFPPGLRLTLQFSAYRCPARRWGVRQGPVIQAHHVQFPGPSVPSTSSHSSVQVCRDLWGAIPHQMASRVGPQVFLS